MSPPRPPRNIVFDVGGVLVELRYGRFVEYLSAAGGDLRDLRTWAALVGLELHETGRLDGTRFLERVARSVRKSLDPEELVARWLDMFAPEPQMIALARGLTDEHRVYLLSNVGDLHWSHLDASYGIATVGHGALPSFLAHARKPDLEIYRAAEVEFGLDPADTVFIDDLAVNVAGARSCGWNGIEHRSPAETCAALSALGVRLPRASIRSP
jgi:HAD superfamily hydrolase (TIGR01509 family)